MQRKMASVMETEASGVVKSKAVGLCSFRLSYSQGLVDEYEKHRWDVKANLRFGRSSLWRWINTVQPVSERQGLALWFVCSTSASEWD